MATTMTLKPVAKSGKQSEDILLLTVDWLSDASGDASVSTADFNYLFRPITQYIQGRQLNIAQTKPGAVTPTSYNAVVTDDNGEDLFGGNLASRSTTATESSYTYNTAVYGSRPIDGDLTITIDTAGNAKTGSITLEFE